MKGPNNFIDDATRVFSGALGVAQGAASEAQTNMKSFVEKLMRDQGYVTRDEFDAVAEMARNARREVDALRKEMESLKAAPKSATKPKTAAKPKTKKGEDS